MGPTIPQRFSQSLQCNLSCHLSSSSLLNECINRYIERFSQLCLALSPSTTHSRVGALDNLLIAIVTQPVISSFSSSGGRATVRGVELCDKETIIDATPIKSRQLLLGGEIDKCLWTRRVADRAVQCSAPITSPFISSRRLINQFVIWRERICTKSSSGGGGLWLPVKGESVLICAWEGELLHKWLDEWKCN